MIAYFFIVFGSLFFLTGSALLALRWAARTGQLRHFQKTALSIFDEEEPVGQMTDAFPGETTPGYIVRPPSSWPRATPQGSGSSGRESAPSSDAQNRSRLTPAATQQP